MSPPFRTEAHELATVRPVLVTTHVHDEVTRIQLQILKSEQELSRHHVKDMMMNTKYPILTSSVHSTDQWLH